MQSEFCEVCANAAQFRCGSRACQAFADMPLAYSLYDCQGVSTGDTLEQQTWAKVLMTALLGSFLLIYVCCCFVSSC
ncbi:MAG: uncharacterized protein KVP18_000689 [Porospora cf. gigantea A]|uniref:uncharacterized protein n=1 Tax=Porospora cf. gigantea A TaxID=2853593 RepID=UPI003559A6FC|nr:MAG: hypothetical protein KVP18_000689 [Porospora cf. gigantea A]